MMVTSFRAFILGCDRMGIEKSRPDTVNILDKNPTQIIDDFADIPAIGIANIFQRNFHRFWNSATDESVKMFLFRHGTAIGL
jgi:hypothetical protein